MDNFSFNSNFSDCKKRTKIVASLGPASQSVDVMKQMLQAGVNIFRLNFSFGDHQQMKTYVDHIREASKQTNIPCSILGDLQGPKFRTNDFEGGSIQLEKGKTVKFQYSHDKIGYDGLITCPHESIVRDLKVGDKILLYDGTMELKITKRNSPTEIETEVVMPGKLYGRKGINVPQLKIQLDDMLEKDKQDALCLLELEVDFIGLSFVQSSHDIVRLREFINKNVKPNKVVPTIISKIEKPQALDDIDQIMKETDGIMVARGDLGVELSLELVPIAQKMLIKKANEAGKPVITATQMLSTMETNDKPTRAEVSDIANAVFDGSDATMTSAETSMSPHPVLVISTMTSILKTTEQFIQPVASSPLPSLRNDPDSSLNHDDLRYAAVNAALEACQSVKAKAIITFSNSGEMAKLISKGRPKSIIISFTPKDQSKIINQLRLFYGIYPFELEYGLYSDTTIAKAEEIILSQDLLASGDWVVICGGNNLPIPGLKNFTKIYQLGEYMKTFLEKFTHKKH
jgi:pyruvate kinase